MTQLDQQTMDLWAKSMRNAPNEEERKTVVWRFEANNPNTDSSWLLDVKYGGGFRGEMIAIEMRAKKERSALIREAMKSGEYTPKPRVTQADFDIVIGQAIDAPNDRKGTSILEDYSEKNSKSSDWVETAKVAESRVKARKALGKYKSSAVMKQLKAYKLLLPYHSDLTGQKLRNILDTIQRKKAMLALLIEQEQRIRELEAVVAEYTGIEPTTANVLMLKAQGFNNTQIAKRINRSVSTVQRLAKKAPE